MNEASPTTLKKINMSSKKELPSITSIDDRTNSPLQGKKMQSLATSSVIGEPRSSSNLPRPARTFNILKEHRTVDDRYQSSGSNHSKINSTQNALPQLTPTRRNGAGMAPNFGFQAETPRKKQPVKLPKVSIWGKYVPADNPIRKDKPMMQEVLERIVMKDREKREMSEGIYRKASRLHGERTGRTRTLKTNSPVNDYRVKQEFSLNFSSARNSTFEHPGEQALQDKSLDVTHILIKGSDMTQSLLRPEPLEDRANQRFSDPAESELPKDKKKLKVKVTSRYRDKNLVPVKPTVLNQEGGTMSTHEY